MLPDDEGKDLQSSGIGMLQGWLPVIRAVCESYMCLPADVGRLTLDQVLFLCIKRGLLIKSREPGWSFEGNVSVMSKESVVAKGMVKPRAMSYFQHVKQEQAKKKAKQRV